MTESEQPGMDEVGEPAPQADKTIPELLQEIKEGDGNHQAFLLSVMREEDAAVANGDTGPDIARGVFKVNSAAYQGYLEATAANPDKRVEEITGHLYQNRTAALLALMGSPLPTSPMPPRSEVRGFNLPQRPPAKE